MLPLESESSLSLSPPMSLTMNTFLLFIGIEPLGIESLVQYDKLLLLPLPKERSNLICLPLPWPTFPFSLLLLVTVEDCRRVLVFLLRDFIYSCAYFSNVIWVRYYDREVGHQKWVVLTSGHSNDFPPPSHPACAFGGV